MAHEPATDLAFTLVPVTAEDIASVADEENKRGALASALKRAFGTEDVSVGFSANINGDRYRIAQGIWNVIAQLEAGEDVEPFAFQLGEKYG